MSKRGFLAGCHCLLLAIAATSPAIAQQGSSMPMHGGMQMGSGSMSPKNMMPMQKQSMSHCMNMMEQGLGPADKNYDKRFIDMMIPHHQGAIDMAKDALSKAQHPALRKLAQNIIDAQEKEIRQLQTWRAEWYGK